MMVIVAMTLASMIIGCGARAKYTQSENFSGSSQSRQAIAGEVPVHIDNPALGKQQVCFFEGSTPVRIIPDAKTGGWKYSRPAFTCITVAGANSRYNWHEYTRIDLPRNFSYTWAARQSVIFLGQSEPYFGWGRTGSNPYAVRYWSVTPSRSQVSCGGLIRLADKPTSVRPLYAEIEVDFRPIGAAITRGLTNAIYGR
jgi:hypothetical protein